jgi:hypothetical protein
MKRYLHGIIGLIAMVSICHANNQVAIKEATIVKNVHGIVESGTWFNFVLQNSITTPNGGQSSMQPFTAKLVSPIYNKNFTELLIPTQTMIQKPRKKGKPPVNKVIAGAILTGAYKNDGDTCTFIIETISFNDTEIEFKPGAYSTVNASLPNQSECNSKLNYSSGQLLEFQIKVDIPNLYPIRFDKNLKELSTQNSYVQAYGNSDYVITEITKFTNGFMQVAVKFYDNDIKDKLVPVFYDEFDIPHQINFLRVDGQQSRNFSTSTYLLGADYQKFGFGVLE